VAISVLALTATMLFFVGRLRESFLVASAVASATVANIVLKEMIARSRPSETVSVADGGVRGSHAGHWSL